MGVAKNKGRQCPAIGATISPADCGEGRNSKYACPADCPFNPFAVANYSQLLEIETALDHKTLAWTLGEPNEGAAFKREFDKLVRSGALLATHACAITGIFLRRDSAGLTSAQRWERAGFPGLKNDERALFRAKMGTHIVLLEVHRVVDDERLEVVDLLHDQPRPFTLVDRSLARRAPRFETLLGWAFSMPHYWRLSGSAIAFPDLGDLAAAEALREIVRHLGGPDNAEGARAWAAENFARINDAVTATSNGRRRRMLASIDAQFCSATYELRAPFAECRATLDAVAEVGITTLAESERAEGFAEARDWFDDSGGARASTIAAGRPCLGRILLGQASWRVEATGAKKMDRLRERFEKALGRKVAFSRERRDDLGARMAAEEPAGDSALVPPRLLENIGQIVLSTSQVMLPAPNLSPEEATAHFQQQFLRSYPDSPLPALDGRTPRAAAADPVLRPKLIRLMKIQVRQRDEDNLRTGRTDDINWLVRELGLHEMDFPPPPKREPLGDFDESAAADASQAEDAVRVGSAASSQPFAMLPAEPLSFEESQRRLQSALESFDTAAAAMAALDAAANPLDALYDATDGLLDEEEFSCLVPFFLNLWYAFVPPGTRGPMLDADELHDGIQHKLSSLENQVSRGPRAIMDSLLAGLRQPILSELAAAGFLDTCTRMPRKQQPDPETQMNVVVALISAADAIDRGLRG